MSRATTRENLERKKMPVSIAQRDRSIDQKIASIAELGIAYGDAGEDHRVELTARYLLELAELLHHESGEERVVKPLIDLIEVLTSDADTAAAERGARERRTGREEASVQVLGRIAAVQDGLVTSGFTVDHAAQLLARQMVRSGVTMPTLDGDPRTWRRLITWRKRLLQTQKPAAAWSEYRNFKRALLEAYGDQAGMRAAGQPLWDLRV